jgi:hypothetical protein
LVFYLPGNVMVDVESMAIQSSKRRRLCTEIKSHVGMNMLSRIVNSALSMLFVNSTTIIESIDDITYVLSLDGLLTIVVYVL